MANRTMQAKGRKLRWQRRKAPRRLVDPPGQFIEHSSTPIPARLKAEGMSAPRTPNRDVMDMYKTSANSLKTKDWKGKFKGVTPKRLEVLTKIDVALSQVRQVVGDDMPSFTIFHTHFHRARVFYNATKTQWMIVHEDYVRGVVERSIVYSDKMRLVDDFKNKRRRLVWIETRLSNHTEGG